MSATGFTYSKTTLEHAGPQFRHGLGMGRTIEVSRGQIASTTTWIDKLPHPPNMYRYDDLAKDSEAGIGLEMLADMIAGTGCYVEMPEKDPEGKEIDPEHPNKKTIELWLRGKEKKFRQIEYVKLCKGFCPCEILPDQGNDLKLLSPETFFIWRSKIGETLKYTQDVGGSEVAKWETKADMARIILFIHNEDPTHPYGKSRLENLADLIDGRKQINKDMPKIIHRYSAPKGVWATQGDVEDIYNVVTGADVDEDFFFGHVNKEQFWFQFNEPSGQTRFLEYINQINFQIGEGLHAPLIMLLRNATEASATKMLESVDRMVQGEQRDNSLNIEDNIIKHIVGFPTPVMKWGAAKAVFNDITLSDIAALYNAKGQNGMSLLTWPQAQDLIRQKGIPLIEAEEPETPIIPPNPDIPLLDQPAMHQLEVCLNTLKQNFDAHNISITEAIREGDRAINVFIEKSKAEAVRKLSVALGKPIVKLSPESERCFTLMRNEIFDDFREALLPTHIKGGVPANGEPRAFTVVPQY